MSKSEFTIERHDLSLDKSLRAWSAADEYLLKAYQEQEGKTVKLGLYNDRFGFLSAHLHSDSPLAIISNKSQEKAIKLNCEFNKVQEPTFADPLSDSDEKFDLVLLKIPKSLDLFMLYLEHIVANSNDEVKVICAFMTRNFSPKLIQIAEEYFDIVEQGLALKKARLLTLTKKKIAKKKELISSLSFKDHDYKQYLGVFSADHIDYATQFFLNHVEVKPTDCRILDLASGNGVIANEIFKQNPESEFHLMDDSYLAVASAKMNISGEKIFHHFNNDLILFEDEYFDIIVTNPPFHFEYEINIQIPLALFKDCHRCLKIGGSLQIVSNKHLNYKTHLLSVFKVVEVVAEDKKFVVYKCVKYD